MRLWTLHPRYLDAPGMVAAWREALGARAVLAGETQGYRHHPQLARFREHPEPSAAIAAYLAGLYEEGLRRGYRFDGAKVPAARFCGTMDATDGQLAYEWRLLLAKLSARRPALFEAHQRVARPDPHPLFRIVPGGIAPWERPRTDLVER